MSGCLPGPKVRQMPTATKVPTLHSLLAFLLLVRLHVGAGAAHAHALHRTLQGSTSGGIESEGSIPVLKVQRVTHVIGVGVNTRGTEVLNWIFFLGLGTTGRLQHPVTKGRSWRLQAGCSSRWGAICELSHLHLARLLWLLLSNHFGLGHHAGNTLVLLVLKGGALALRVFHGGSLGGSRLLHDSRLPTLRRFSFADLWGSANSGFSHLHGTAWGNPN